MAFLSVIAYISHLEYRFFDALLYTASNRRSGGVLGKEFQRYMCHDTKQESLLFGRKMCLAFFSKTFIIFFSSVNI